MKWLDNFQDGGQFEGYTNKGFNYNGAWGGPAQQGIRIGSSNPGDEVVNNIQYGADVLQEAAKFVGKKGALNRLPIGLGAAFGLIDSAQNSKPVKPADILGLVPNVWAQIGSELIDYEQNTPERYSKFAQAGKPKLQKPVLKETRTAVRDNYQDGGRLGYENELMSKVISGRNKDLNFVQRAANPSSYPKIITPEGKEKTHRMTYADDDKGNYWAYPTVVQRPTGELEELGGMEADRYAQDSGEQIMIPDRELADYYTKQGLIKHRGGGIITDPMGQWAHPGEITKIPSNDITMEGVDYPVLGIPNKGKAKMMYPGEHYMFPDASSVTEIPKKNGNFTNKKQSGGWLDNF